ncbi:sulfur carrier protein ThiS [Enterobacterales bacterium CwR94]|nr:sulfur carrier protein ThiS [Enterobacterales bacterium CwR94]
MNIIVNDEVVITAEANTLSHLLAQLTQDKPGTALAVNQVIIPRAHWPVHILQEGDELVIFQAIAGG